MEKIQMEQGNDRREKLLVTRITLKKGNSPLLTTLTSSSSYLCNFKTGIKMKGGKISGIILKIVSLKQE
jgi:hypothetical protein